MIGAQIEENVNYKNGLLVTKIIDLGKGIDPKRRLKKKYRTFAFFQAGSN